MELTGKQRRYLRGLGHELRPVVQIGKEGLSEATIAATAQALLDHELIKVKLGDNAGLDREEAGEELAQRTDSHLAQVLGATLLLYRAHPERPTIELP
ncbi:MAG: ribosome assembly RNA-binding protein YhbY [Kofleriaceae bacterium]